MEKCTIALAVQSMPLGNPTPITDKILPIASQLFLDIDPETFRGDKGHLNCMLWINGNTCIELRCGIPRAKCEITIRFIRSIITHEYADASSVTTKINSQFSNYNVKITNNKDYFDFPILFLIASSDPVIKPTDDDVIKKIIELVKNTMVIDAAVRKIVPCPLEKKQLQKIQYW